MEKPLAMPKLGMTMTDGTVLKWNYQEGDFVEKDEALLEVMTDKVNIEVEAPFSGYLVKILAGEGTTLPVGEPLAMLATEQPAAVSSASSESKPSTAPAQTVARTTVASTPAARREAALQGIDLLHIAQAGVALPLLRSDVQAFVLQNGATTAAPRSEEQSKLVGATLIQEPEAVWITPIAQKIAKEHGLNLEQLASLKSGGKLTRSDVEAYIATRSARPAGSAPPAIVTSPSQLAASTTTSPPQPTQADLDSELVPLSPVRQLIGQRMVSSFSSIPHIYLDVEVDMLEAERCRQRVGESWQVRNEKAPSFTSILLRALAATLVLHPQVNAALEPKGLQGKDAIRQWRNVHIGIAVDTGSALLTPVLRNAQSQSLLAISQELRRLTQAAHQGKLKPEDMTGATFTVSNLGMYGIDTFHAIIAPGQGAILAVGKVTKRGIVLEDKQGERIEIRPMMKLSLSADHRILDGATGSRFLQQLKAFLEDPYLLL